MNKMDFLKFLTGMFNENGIETIPLKFHDFDNDIDLLVVNKRKYKKAHKILIKNNFFKVNTVSYLREHDKGIYHSKNYTFDIHLHSRISQNAILLVSSKLVWKNKILKKGIFFPSENDEILIIASHGIFERKYISKEDLEYFTNVEKKLDWDYILNNAKKYNWGKGIKLFKNSINSYRQSPEKKAFMYKFSDTLKVTLNKLISDLAHLKLRIIPWEIFVFFVVDYFWCYKGSKKRLERGWYILKK